MAKHRYLCPMRWADMDIYQHINNSAFFSYLEQARIDARPGDVLEHGLAARLA